MSDEQSHKASRARGPLIAIALLASLLIVLSSLGTELPSPLKRTTVFYEPSCATTDGRNTAIVDMMSKRLLILNGKDEVTGIVDLASTSTPIDTICDVCVVDDVVYVCGTKYAGATSAIASDRILKFSLSGRYLGELFAIERDAESKDADPAIVSLSPSANGIYAAVSSMTVDGKREPEGKLSILHVTGEKKSETVLRDELSDLYICCADYNERASLACAVDLSGLLGTMGSRRQEATWSDVGVVTSAAVTNEGNVVVCTDDKKGVTLIQDGRAKPLLEGGQYDSVRINGSEMAACGHAAETVTLCHVDGTDDRTITSAPMALPMFARSVAVWGAGLLLIVAALAFGIRRLVAALRCGNTGALSSLLGISCVVVVIVVGVTMFAKAMEEREYNVRCDEVNVLADIYADSCPEELRKAVVELGSDRDITRSYNKKLVQSIPNVQKFLRSLCQSASKNGIGLYYNLYGIDKDGVFNIVGYGIDNVYGTKAKESTTTDRVRALIDEGDADNSLNYGSTRYDDTVYRLVPIRDNNKVVAVLELGCKLSSIWAQVAGKELSLVISFLAVLLVVYLVYSELRGCGRELIASRAAAQDSASDAAAALARPLAFLAVLVSSADAVMIVLIAKDMLEATGHGNDVLLLALPVASLRLGMCAGSLLLQSLVRRIGFRQLVLGGCLASVVLSLVAMGSVMWGSFELFCCARFFMSIPLGMLYALGAMLPTKAKDEGIRGRGTQGVALINVSAAALGLVGGGFVGQVAGDAMVYALAALCATLGLAVFFTVTPYIKTPLIYRIGGGGQRARETLGFVLSAPALMILGLVVLPMVAASGYQSYVFPVYASGLGLSKLEITNLFASAQLVVYLLVSPLITLRNRLGQGMAAVVCVAGIGAAFLLTSVNNSLLWVFCAIVVIAVFVKMADAWKSLWIAAAARRGLDSVDTYGSMVACSYAVMTAQPLVMGLFIAAGHRLAAVTIGAFCLVCSAFHLLVVRRESKQA